MDKETAHDFVAISHRLGHLIHYGHDTTLRDIVILRPDWLATAISFVLDDRETRARNGLVDGDRLAYLWNDPARPAENRYEAHCFPIFRALMERYDLAYRIAEPAGPGPAAETILVAQLVPDVRPIQKLAAAWPASPASHDVQQTQICKVLDAKHQTATAEGLFYWLIVRLHKYSLGRADYAHSIHWQRGLVLEDTYGARALLEHLDNDIRITVRSPYPERFLSALTYEVQWLVESFWKNLRCSVTVPCLNPRDDDPPCPGALAVQLRTRGAGVLGSAEVDQHEVSHNLMVRAFAAAVASAHRREPTRRLRSQRAARVGCPIGAVFESAIQHAQTGAARRVRGAGGRDR